MDPTFTDTTPATEDTNTMLPADEAFKGGCASWLYGGKRIRNWWPR